MSASYIPEDTYAVCTFQMNGTPQKFIATRDPITVLHKDKIPLLTKEDKNLDEKFTCKSPVSFWGTLLAFGAGLLLACTPIGWVVGAIILVATIVVVARIITHDCTDPLKSGDWMLFHPSVEFDKFEAITEVSMLKCGKGGVLTSFFSYAAAVEASRNIRNNNLKEVATNVVISFLGGISLAKGGIALIAKYGLTKATVVLYAVDKLASLIMKSMEVLQTLYMRNDEDLKDNQTYQNLNKIKPIGSSEKPVEPDKPDRPEKPIEFSDVRDLGGFGDAVNDGKKASMNSELFSRLKGISGMTTAQLKDSTKARELFKDINSGKYGQKIKNELKHRSGKVNTNSTNVNRGANVADKNINDHGKKMIKNTGKGALFFLPLLENYFAEKTRKIFAEAAEKDTGGINISATSPQ